MNARRNTLEPTQAELLPVRIRLLGGFRASVGSREVGEGAWRLRKAASLVKLLALAPAHALHREQVVDLLWPNLEAKAARNNLRGALHVARRALDPDQVGLSQYLALRDEQIVLCPEGNLWVDVEAFERAAVSSRGSRDPSLYEAAIDLYAGELLPEDRYEGWAEGRRQELRETFVSLLLGLAWAHETRGDYGSAVEILVQATRQDPINEEAYTGLMRLYAHLGRKAEALRRYKLLEQTLSQKLGVEPSSPTRALRTEIASGRFPSEVVPSLAPRTRTGTASSRPHLPAPRTSFVGRERELVEVKRALATTRLLTLTGTGGSGKTRLALRVAADVAGAYHDGAWFVDLAGLFEPNLVSHAVAGAVGARERPDLPIVETVVRDLREKEALLILDNCEHLVGAVARLVDLLLNSCPHLVVMATSREPLGVGDETLFSIPPLPVPAGLPAVPGEVAHSDSTRLFVERARQRLPGFSLTRQNFRAVAEICKRLEGIPLAIELAAARMGTLATEQVAERLEDSLILLAGGPKTVPPRQRTMRAAIEWSYRQLSEAEKDLFGRASVFAGGFTLEAAEVVCPDGIAEDNEVLDLISSLVDKSLVAPVATTQGRIRYRMLEPVRQYARERLGDGGDADTMLGRHADFFLALAEESESELKGARQGEWLERLEVEHDNLRAALSWALEEGEADLGLRLCAALAEFWHLHVHHDEARRWLEGALAMESGSPAARASALERAAFLAWEQGDYGGAVALGREGLALARSLGDEAVVAGALLTLGSVEMSRMELRQASAMLEEALRVRRALEDDRGVAHTLHVLGLVAVLRRDNARAKKCYEESLTLARRSGNEVGIVQAMGQGALAALVRGEGKEADTLAKTTMRLARRLGIRHYTFGCLAILAASAALRKRPARAARLWGAEDALRAAIGIPRMPAELFFYEPYAENARAKFDEAAWEAAWAEGRTMEMEQAIEYALADEEHLPGKPPVSEEASDGTETNLSCREAEVATLVAQGLTNRQIAKELSISEHTAATHVRRILKKLGLNSRSQLATWVTKQVSPLRD